jgi:hypothetical protein
MDKERLEELKRLCEDATPGPWEDCLDQLNAPSATVIDHEWGPPTPNAPEGTYASVTRADADFIAASRTALPELIAEVEFLTKVAEQMRAFAKIGSDGKWLTCTGCKAPEYGDPELAQYLKRGKE